MNTEQIEIGFHTNLPHPPSRKARRRHRAHWWFQRMRSVANQALDWKPAPAARPQQIYLALAKSR